MSTRKTTRRNSGGSIVDSMLYIRNQVKLYHWQTNSFSRHTATDELVKSLDENIDKFVEVFMGKYGTCLLYTSPSPRDRTRSRMPSSA